ncbi:histidine kinase [Gilvimarinus sp. SDUM040013]|uniref:Histidine kinase n=1 Tax=Gilvimarinus gilvus TaxID=3058038 RepID=A0ABU4RXC5_9GAMM|nr:histidine kinase [Gilvimarinus sp. SDUM040013]MDO3388622.1 histidine kinase [Gilvimarinus sp. SDUM040013]MDX6849517.1 histidine kinase [Gilvimarinus sp. SDUM040013]
MTKNHTYYLVQIIAWSLFSVAHILFTLMSMPLSNVSVVNGVFIGAVGLVVSHTMRTLFLRRWLQQLALLPLLGKILLLVVICAAIWESLIIFVLHIGWLHFYDLQSISVAATLFWYYYYFVVLSLWVMLYFGINVALKRRRETMEKLQLELILKESQLANLKNQLNPHFLFNALNSVRALVLENPEKSRSMITQLASLLRYSLRDSEQHTQPLQQELDAVRAYLELEKVRFEDRLNYQFSVAEGLHDEPVLPMSIQTLVENAVKHGLAQRPEGGSISVKIEKRQGWIEVEVINSGHLRETASGEHSTGTGLPNTRARLEQVFGPQAGLELEQKQDQVVARMSWGAQS